MFNFVHKHKKMIQLILALLFIPFMFSGVYGSMSSAVLQGDAVAKVGKQVITKAMFDQSFSQYKARASARLGDRFSEADFDTPEQRLAVLNQLVDQYAVEQEVQAEHLTVTDAQLLSALLKSPIMARDAQGNIDREKYHAVLKRMQMSETQYEDGIRANLSADLIGQVAGASGALPPLQEAAVTDVLTQARLVEIKPVDLTPYIAKATVSDGAVEAYYKAHTSEFTKTETFDVDFAVIPVLPAGYVPSDADIKAAFGGSPTAADIEKVRKDPTLIQQVLVKTAQAKMESVAKAIDAASSKAPQDMAAIVAQFGGKLESAKNVTREGDDSLPDALKTTDARLALITGTQVAAKAISSPVKVSDTSLILGRVTHQAPAGLLPLNVVKADIEKTLKQESVLTQARADAAKQVASMNVRTPIGSVVAVGPLLRSPLSNRTVSKILALGTKDVPKLLVSEDPNSVSIVRALGEDPNKPTLDKFSDLKPALQQWTVVSAVLQQRAYINILRERLGVKLYPEHLGGMKSKT